MQNDSIFIPLSSVCFVQEALWREEVMKKKLSALQEATSSLVNSSSTIWRVRLCLSVRGLSSGTSQWVTVTVSKYQQMSLVL